MSALFAASTARAAVDIDQSPLTVKSALPPNIVLVFDDSGSMAWSSMPDDPTGGTETQDQISSSDINGVYYNPNINYVPPFTSNGTSYFTAYSFDDAPLNGFNPGGSRVHVATYKGANDTVSGSSTKPEFSSTFKVSVPAGSSSEPATCATGTPDFANPANYGKCVVIQTQPPSCSAPTKYNLTNSNSSAVNCTAKTDIPDCASGYTFNGTVGSSTAGLCVDTDTPRCPNASPSYSLINQNTSNVICSRNSGNPRTTAATCRSGFTADFSNQNNLGQCVRTATPTCSNPLNVLSGSGASRVCTVTPTTTSAVCGTGYTADFSSTAHPGQCIVKTVSNPICQSGYSLTGANSAGVGCSRDAYSKYRSLFTYTVKAGNGYTRYFVGAASEDNSGNGSASAPKAGVCSNITSGTVTRVNSSDTTLETYSGGVNTARCLDSNDARQRVANWFSYYRTRLLLAKSGLMNAFSDLDPTIRFGFGSINGDENSNGENLPTPKTSEAGRAPIAMVAPFGDGATGTRKKAFWDWLAGVTANSGTPLRATLDSVGKYYQTDHPWLTDVTDEDSAKLSCRQSYTILNTDGLWNSDDGFWDDSEADEIYGGNVDAAIATTTSTVTAQPSCNNGYSIDRLSDSSMKGRCVDPDTPKCNTGYSLINTNTASVLCKRNTGTTTQTPTCNSGFSATFSDSFTLGRCSRIATPQCSTSGFTLIDQNTENVMCSGTTTSTGSGSVTLTGPNAQTYTYTPSAPYSDSHSETLADVAMYYWLTDLQPDDTTGVLNNVPTNDDDPAFWQHMTTFTVGLFSKDFQLPGISPSGTTPDEIFDYASSGDAPNNFAWPAPGSGGGQGTSANLADLVHAGVNGHGGFYSAGDPEQFVNGLKDALRRVQDRVGTGASLAANSTKLQTGTTTYQALYYSGEWKGDLKALAVDPNTGAIGAVPIWTAAGALPDWDDRNIKTYNPAGGTAAQKFPAFDDPAKLSPAQKTALGAAAEQQAMIDYLRGDDSNDEGNDGDYRERDTPLGDIISSQPVYVGAPSSSIYLDKDFTGADAYAAFAGLQASREPRIWIAANDGMLHSFDADSGEEVFAYLPNAVILNGITKLANPSYGSNAEPHQYFNDGEITVADAYIGNAWKTILVGTTGRGVSKAIYALDITDPDEPKLLWERAANDTMTNSNYIGQIIGKPVIAQTADGVWSVLTGNGFNSATGKAALLQFELSAGALTVYETDAQTNNSLAPPAVWIDDPSNVISTRAYAGDFKGRIWEFTLGSSGGTGSRLFTTSSDQPVSGGMLAGKDPETGNVWLFFGTGRYLTQDDLEDSSLQSWYGLIVQSGPGQPASLVTNLATDGRAALVERTILDEEAPTSDSLGAREIETSESNDMDGKSGWFMDLKVGSSERGERTVTPNQFQGNLLLGTTRIPGAGSDPCNPSGDGWIMALDPFTGGAPDSLFFDLNGDGVFDESDEINGAVTAGIGFTSIPNNPIFVGNVMLTSFDNATTSSILTAGSTGTPERQSWRELVDQ